MCAYACPCVRISQPNSSARSFCRDLEDCLKEGVDPARLHALLVDPDSPVQQGGKFRLEATFTSCLIKATKAYDLRGKLDDDPAARRMRSVARRTQKLLQPHHFGQHPDKQAVVIGHVSLRATKGMEMTIAEEYKKVSHGFNFQRTANVSSRRDAKKSHSTVSFLGPRRKVSSSSSSSTSR